MLKCPSCLCRAMRGINGLPTGFLRFKPPTRPPTRGPHRPCTLRPAHERPMASLGRDTTKGTSAGDQLGSSPTTRILATLAPHMYAAVHCDREGKLTAVRSDLGTGLTGRSALGTGKIATRSHSSQIPNIAHPMRLPRRHRSRRFICHFWCTWWRCKAPFAGVGAPRKVCESRDQRRMTSSEIEPWESPGTCSSVVIDSSIIPVLHIARCMGRSEAEACAESVRRGRQSHS